ncbi:gluconokinase [Actinocrispum wychmicini]|uniref:Gluconokinase n=1 Tax=Actinocrispum wychmicini TaxID=1213861 RepID=A0A4R2JIT8_9PSEU|nr:gluconokinase [Actinocrispum wychmicini]TCO58687.1 gluconokinase [Actinocrispum wychmicini]
MVIVVMGVSGSGKTTVGKELAARLDVEYAEADEFHPPANIAKMSAGHPLTDEDRWPWLRAIAQWIGAHEESGGVVTCSALKRPYRDLLRTGGPVYFVHLTGSHDVIAARLAGRQEHFMPAALLDSQIADLEPLGPDEPGIVLDIDTTPDVLVAAAFRAVG